MWEKRAERGFEMEKVKLFTKQNDKTLAQLERDGRFINVRLYVELHLGDIAPFFVKKYDWLTREAARRLPKPDDVKAPIWCAVSPRSCMHPEPGTVVYCLEVPRDQIIFFDNFKWDYVLNQLYLPKDDADMEAYQKHLADLGIKSRFDFSKDLYRNMYPQEIKRIEASWIRIFDLDEWNIWNVCGNIWEIRQEWVKRIIPYGEEIDEAAIQELEQCGPGVSLFDERPADFKQLEPRDKGGAGGDIWQTVDEESSPMLSQSEMRKRMVV